MSNKAISEFLDKHNGKEFVGFVSNFNKLPAGLEYYHLFSDGILAKMPRAAQIHTLLIKIQQMLHIRQFKDVNRFAKGCNWWSITRNLAEALVAEKKAFIRRYRFTQCSDEIFVQTFIKEHPEFAANVYCWDSEYKGCMRYIDWDRGYPYVFQPGDFDELANANRFFARKFAGDSSMDLLHRLGRRLNAGE